MSSFFLDANALVYWVYPGSPFHDEISRLLEKICGGAGSVYALSSSLNEVYYALHRHYMGEAQARACIRDIAEVLDLVDLTGMLVFNALDSNEPDYGDGLVRAAAEALQVDALITYDKKAFRRSFIPSMSAHDALERFMPAV